MENLQTRTAASGESDKAFDSAGLIETCKLRFRTLEEAESVADFMMRFYPDPQRVLPGLHALLANAVEHGNLEIGYEQKTALIASGEWVAEIMRRLGMEEYRGRMAETVISRRENGIYAVITDQGKGFEWKRYMTVDPSRAGDSHGRGIALACAKSFDKVTYNEAGNQAVTFVSKRLRLQW